MKLIEIKDLDYFYPEEQRKSLDNINFSVEKGSITLITGPSGSGKSTLLKCVTGAVPEFYGGKIKGSVLLNGNEVSKLSRNARAKTAAMVFQDPERQLVMNKVHREVAFGLENIGEDEKRIKRMVFEALQFLNLQDLAYRDISTLSGGEKQKVAIASALAFLPSCILLDEPTSQLDPFAADEILSLIKKINMELNITIVIVEQRVDRWFEVSDKVAVMENGKIIFDGEKDKFYDEDKLVNYMPAFLRLSKKLHTEKMPLSFKEARSMLAESEFNKPLNQEKRGKTIFEAKKLTVKFGDFKAVKEAEFSVKEGEALAILGANGAGKSTILKSCLKLVDYRGIISFEGHDIKKIDNKNLYKMLGYVSQNPNDYLTKDTVYEELKFTLDNHGVYDEKIIYKVLDGLNLLNLKDKNPRDLSGGEKQRAAIASILVLNPKVIFLDEPTRGLDRETKADLLKYVNKLKSFGTSFIIVTHDMEFAVSSCDKFLLMFKGEAAAFGGREVLQQGLFYSTTVNKLLREKAEWIYTEEEAQRLVIRE